MAHLVKVCVFHTLRDHFDYLWEGDMPATGSRVLVPFGRQTRIGLVIGQGDAVSPGLKLKTIDSILDEKPLITKAIMDLCLWVSRYYQSPLSEVLPMALPKKYRMGSAASLATLDYFELTMPEDTAHSLISKAAKKQHALIDYMVKNPQPLTKKELIQAGFSALILKPLLELGILHCLQKPTIPPTNHKETTAPLPLNREQAIALEKIGEHLHHYHCFLLQGVTGSGKTEVYLQAIAHVLEKQQQVLILVPEIGLTPQLLSRFSARFNEPMAVIHSNLNETEREQAWLLAQTNQVKLVIGTRAAVFTSMPALGLIVVDEEHDPSLKQAERVRYSARDTALIRAHQANIPIILGTATPSLESLQNAFQGKYTLLTMTQKALTQSPLHFQITDLRNIPLQQGLAASTLKTIEAHLKAENQVLVFINRRGFAPVLLCHQCGWMADCSACDSHMTLHKSDNRLICHHCGLGSAVPAICKNCQSKELIPVGAGTQRIHDFLSKQFPNTPLLRIDRDEVRKKNELDNRLEQIAQGKAQLIVGTQMLAKGHHFPRLTLVVILDVDAGFYNHDFRALERLGQLLIQVSGRAGRANKPGEVIIQTHMPHHPLLNLLVQQGYPVFAEALLQSRQQASLPPYHYMAVIRAQDKKVGKILQFLHQIRDHLKPYPIEILGPAPAPLARKAHLHRMQLLLKSPSRKLLQSTLTMLREWLTMDKSTNSIRWNIDVDPMDLS